jgi:hypothetical protein
LFPESLQLRSGCKNRPSGPENCLADNSVQRRKKEDQCLRIPKFILKLQRTRCECEQHHRPVGLRFLHIRHDRSDLADSTGAVSTDESGRSGVFCTVRSVALLPLMTVELFSSAWLAWKPLPGQEVILITGCVFVGLIWASTFFLQVPMHDQLSEAFNADIHASLVQTNWIRTVLWSTRSALMIWVLANVLLSRSEGL